MQASEALQSNLTGFAINSQAILDSIPQRIEEEGTSHVQGKLTFNSTIPHNIFLHVMSPDEMPNFFNLLGTPCNQYMADLGFLGERAHI